MIGYLIKNWKLLLDLVLVVGGIVALAIFDPFRVFSKATLKNTANLVSSVRSIGELTTAEYYGEVVSSLHETKIYNVPADSLYDVFEDCYIEMRKEVAHTLNKERRIRDRHWKQLEGSSWLAQLKTEYGGKDNGMLYSSLLTFIAANHLEGEEKDYYNVRSNEIRPDTEKKVLQFLTKRFGSFRKNLKKEREDITDLDLDVFALDLPINFTSITDFHYSLLKETIDAKKKRRKKDIVFIGRGRVKAGFRFGQLDESNFYYDSDDRMIQFFGLTPTILDKDINPWFIPEEKIKGFELVDYYNKATFEEAVAVKIKCKEKLLEQAHKADILNAARENGKVALTNFFSLLLDEPDLKVELLAFPYDAEYEIIAADTLVTVNEALMIKNLYDETVENDQHQTQPEIDRERNSFSLFLRRLEKLSFVKRGFRFSLLSLEAAGILEHAVFVTAADYDHVRSLRDPLMLNEDGALVTKYMQELLLYEDYHSFTQDFNQMLRVIDDVVQSASSLRADTLYLTESQRQNQALDLDSAFFNVVAEEAQDTIWKITHKYEEAPLFYDLRYPSISLEPSMFNEVTLTEVDKVDEIILKEREASFFETADPQMTLRVKEELNTLHKFKKDSVKKSIQLRPIRSLTMKVKKLLP